MSNSLSEVGLMVILSAAIPAVMADVLYTHDLDSVDPTIYRVESHDTIPHGVIVGTAGPVLTDIAIHPATGEGFGISGSHFWHLDLGTGAATLLGALSSSGLFANALEVTPAGVIYAGGLGNSHLFTINSVTGAATQLFDTGEEYRGDLAYDPTSGLLYGIAARSTSFDRLVRIDVGAQTLTEIGAIPKFYGLEIDSAGQMFGARDGLLFRVNKTNGSTMLLGQMGGDPTTGAGLAFFVVPEPVTALGAVLAFCFLAQWKRRE